MATTAEESRKNPSKLEQDSFSSHDSEIRRKFQSDNENKEEVEFANETADERAPIGTRESVTEQKQPEESEPVEIILLKGNKNFFFFFFYVFILHLTKVQKPESHDEFRLLTTHSQSVMGIALADDDLTGFSASKDGSIIQCDVESGNTGEYVAFPGHGGPVSCLTFREGASQLISGSYDRTIKLWNVEDRAYMDTLYGQKEHVLSVGRDRTMRLFKVAEESQLVFRAPAASLECCYDGSIKLWNPMRKEPAFIVENAHPILPSYDELSTKDNRVSNGDDAGMDLKDSVHLCNLGLVLSLCVEAVISSGAGNDSVNLWGIDGEAKTIRPMHDLPLVGFVNSLAFANSGRFLLAGVGQEPRLGTWGRNSTAPNGVLIHPLKLSE
ncbi:hypothetical protein MKW92_028264 [Papaver armeniacum]|nr:hypothetical protein MKW92_028264 [Papaver armeniacum]